MSGRQKVEASLRQLERDQALLQHQSAENLRKVEIETDRKRSLENECERLPKRLHACSSHVNSQTSSKTHLQQISLTDGAMKRLLGEFCAFISVITVIFYLLQSEQSEGSAGGSSEKEPEFPNVE